MRKYLVLFGILAFSVMAFAQTGGKGPISILNGAGTPVPVMTLNSSNETVIKSAGNLNISLPAGKSLVGASISVPSFSTSSNCASDAAPAVCGSAAAGHFVIAASATSVTVNSTAVTANSEILIDEDQSVGTLFTPNITCNTGITSLPVVSARTAGTSFTVTISAGLSTNPVCYGFTIIN